MTNDRPSGVSAAATAAAVLSAPLVYVMQPHGWARFALGVLAAAAALVLLHRLEGDNR